MDRANAMFDSIDVDKSGTIEPDELTMHFLSLGQEHDTVSRMFTVLDTNKDGSISREEFVDGFDKLQALDTLASAKAPPPSFAALIAAGTVVPDERDGPYALGSYHANVTGAVRGYKADAGYQEWFATNKAIMAQQRSWGTIDFEAPNAVDPEYMFSYGAINEHVPNCNTSPTASVGSPRHHKN